MIDDEAPRTDGITPNESVSRVITARQMTGRVVLRFAPRRPEVVNLDTAFMEPEVDP